jgi:integrase
MTKYDLVLYGATGFTGKLVANYLASHPSGGHFSWAIAGRNPKKLTELTDAVDMFLEDCENRNRPETIRQYRHYLKAFDWRKKVGDITRVKIQAHLKNYKDRPHAYFHGLASLRVFFNWCVRQEIIDRNPIAGERIVRTLARERVLSPEEIKVLWDYEYPHFSTIVKLCLLTGQRRSEIAAITPDWIHGDVLTFPADVTKNKRRHTIPISSQVLGFLEDVPFGRDGPFNGWSNGKRRIDKYVQIPHWTLHDLRRTFSTIHAELGTPIHITERLLNHASGSVSGVVSVYNRYSYLDEMREAQTKYETCLANIVRS